MTSSALCLEIRAQVEALGRKMKQSHSKRASQRSNLRELLGLMRSVTKIGGDTYLVCERALGLIPSTAKKQKVNLPEVGARLGLATSLKVCLWLVTVSSGAEEPAQV